MAWITGTIYDTRLFKGYSYIFAHQLQNHFVQILLDQVANSQYSAACLERPLSWETTYLEHLGPHIPDRMFQVSM